MQSDNNQSKVAKLAKSALEGYPKQAESSADDTPHAGESEAQGERLPQGVNSREIGGPRGPEPTRYGDWERKGRCIDF
nr:DUF1674 domain-containing protein [Oceanococcus sp. HetDA_MAG_MS8]